ncbi:guanine nucleotide binding protein, alpha subunit [Russula dissimulans]|nr:guanine nucleotide binding protein, alpha subunit [Russula dissimulans]
MSITTRISNITDPHMGLLTPWKQRFEEMRARQLAKTHSDEIDRQIKEEAKAAPFNQQAIILLMSIPKYEEEASTFIGQMKLVHGDDWRKDPADFRPEIWKILLENARSVVKAVKTQNVWPSGHANRANCEYIMSHRIDTDNPQFVFQPRFAQAVKDLWVEEVISALLDWPPCLALHDSDNAAYFVSEAHRIVADNYVPTMEDITHITKKGVMKAYIKAQQLSVQILQWHGHRGIPQKWAHLFEGTTSIVFYASLSGYDRPSADRNQQSHLEESLILFEEVVNSRWFSQTSVILFLTEVKEFKLKLLKVPLCQYFPDYVDDTDGDKGAQYICSQFSRRKRAPLTLYIQ